MGLLAMGEQLLVEL